MTPDRVERRLTAILAADVAGYSRLMGADEEGTLAALKAHRRALVDPKITEHRGRIVKTTGDGMLVEFASVVDAVRCAVGIQRGMIERNAELPQDNRIEFRVGIHQGDVIIEDQDIFGDGVNVAARLESLAEPGGVCVSSRVQEDVRGKLDVSFEDMGEQQLKNIAHPVRVYAVALREAQRETSAKPAITLPDKPSIAVLAFHNMSGDAEQEYFADGIAEDIITALSRFKNLFVIARNSSFTYKGRSVDVKQVGRELGVRYLLEGSVRKAANRVRITGQLVDTSTGTHLWAERFDGGLQEIFDLQDHVTARVVGAIAPKLEQSEIERAKRKPTESLDAYDYYLRALSCGLETDAATSEVLRLLRMAIDLDPDFASAHGLAAFCHQQRKANGWMADIVRESLAAERLARRAIELGKDDALTLSYAAMAIAYLARDVKGAAAMLDRAIVLNSNSAMVWRFSSWVRVWCGEPELAIEHAAQALRLSPLDPYLHRIQPALSYAHLFAGRYDEASSWAERSLLAQPDYQIALRAMAASCALGGRLEHAQNVAMHIRRLNPSFRVSHINELIPICRPEDRLVLEQGLRMAGLPE